MITHESMNLTLTHISFAPPPSPSGLKNNLNLHYLRMPASHYYLIMALLFWGRFSKTFPIYPQVNFDPLNHGPTLHLGAMISLILNLHPLKKLAISVIFWFSNSQT